MSNVLNSFGAVWPAIGAVIVFCGTMYSDVNMLKAETKNVKDNVIYLNTELVAIQKEQLKLLMKMDSRLTVLESKQEWEYKQTQSNNVTVTNK